VPQTLLLALRVRERTALVAEQLALQQRLRQRRAGDGHERPIRTGAAVVDRLGDHVLSGAALPLQQDGRRLAVADLLDQVHDLPHGRAAADQIRLALDRQVLRPQTTHLPAEPGRLQGLLDDHGKLVQVHRLGQVVEGAQLHRLHGALHRPVGGHHHHRHLRDLLADALQDLQAGHVRQPVVQCQEVAVLFLEQGEGLPSGLRLAHAVALLLQALADRPADQLLVLDDQNAFLCHQSASSLGRDNRRRRSVSGFALHPDGAPARPHDRSSGVLKVRRLHLREIRWGKSRATNLLALRFYSTGV